MIDTHCHINFDSYDADRDDVMARAASADVEAVINPAIDLETSRAVLTLCEAYPGLYAAVGVHPNDAGDFTPAVIDELATLGQHQRVVAVGEIGLDYYWNKSPAETQIAALEAQLDLAARLERPVIIHNRDSSDDVIRILEAWAAGLSPGLKTRPGVMHSFSGSMAIAERALAAGFYLGFTGPITYKKADETRAIAAAVPMERLLVETDGPFLTPIPHRGKRNEPAYIPLIVERLAAVKQVSVETMAQATTENARRLFGLPT